MEELTPIPFPEDSEGNDTDLSDEENEESEDEKSEDEEFDEQPKVKTMENKKILNVIGFVVLTTGMAAALILGMRGCNKDKEQDEAITTNTEAITSNTNAISTNQAQCTRSFEEVNNGIVANKQAIGNNKVKIAELVVKQDSLDARLDSIAENCCDCQKSQRVPATKPVVKKTNNGNKRVATGNGATTMPAGDRNVVVCGDNNGTIIYNNGCKDCEPEVKQDKVLSTFYEGTKISFVNHCKQY